MLVNENYITSGKCKLIYSKRCMMLDENIIDFELSIGDITVKAWY